MKQLWKKFDKLTEICYMSELEDNCPQWDEAYEVFKQLVAQGREKDPQYAAQEPDFPENVPRGDGALRVGYD